MQSFKLLIHTALQCEGQFLIDKLKLTQNKDYKTFKLFENEDTILVVSGIGKENTLNCLNDIFEKFTFEKAINLGIAGCCESSVKIGTLFCTNRLLKNINFALVTTVDEPLDSDENLETLLVDMEASYFKEVASKNCSEIYIFKIVSDYLDTQIPKKSFVIELIKNIFPKIESYL